jgi:Cof subfamily protein (haloacid dehalogenase superfamily)
MRLVATDLDGTLLRQDKSVSARTAEALKRLTTEGVHVVLVTGRPVRWLGRVYEQLHEPLPTVCANGALVYDPLTDAVLRARPLAPRQLAEVCRRVRERVPGIAFAVEIEDSREMRHEAAYELYPDADPAVVRRLDADADLWAVPAVKLLARLRGTSSAELVAAMSGCLDGLAEATHSSDSGLVEISAAGVTKAGGLAWLCDRLGVHRRDVVAFGDMPTDVPLLSWAGRAVAMGNAHPAVREIAHDVTLSNDEDGVAAYLERTARD